MSDSKPSQQALEAALEAARKWLTDFLAGAHPAAAGGKAAMTNVEKLVEKLRKDADDAATEGYNPALIAMGRGIANELEQALAADREGRQEPRENDVVFVRGRYRGQFNNEETRVQFDGDEVWSCVPNIALAAQPIPERGQKRKCKECGHEHRSTEYCIHCGCNVAPSIPETEGVRQVLRELLDACLLADAHEELSGYVDGSLLDKARAALAASRVAEALRAVQGEARAVVDSGPKENPQ